MASLSQDDRPVITKHPLDDSLDHLRDSLRKTEQLYDGAGDTCDQGPLKAVSRLLHALQGHDVALTLRSETGAGDLAGAVPKQSVKKGQITVRWFYDGTRLLQFPFSVIVSNKLCTIQMCLCYRLPTIFLPF
jgi:hypothetical protein